MGKFIVATFLILGVVFYEMSGGADFVPEGQRTQVAEAEIVVETPAADVSRLNSATLVNVAAEPEPAAQIIQAVVEDVVVADVAVTEPVAVAPPPLDLRRVAGSRVNMRADAGTSFAVLDTLDGGTEVEVIEVNAIGWARVRVTATGQMGWMAERLLTNG